MQPRCICIGLRWGFHSLLDDECTRGRKEGRFDCITTEENVFFFFTLPFSLLHREEEGGEDSVFSYMIGSAFEPPEKRPIAFLKLSAPNGVSTAIIFRSHLTSPFCVFQLDIPSPNKAP